MKMNNPTPPPKSLAFVVGSHNYGKSELIDKLIAKAPPGELVRIESTKGTLRYGTKYFALEALSYHQFRGYAYRAIANFLRDDKSRIAFLVMNNVEAFRIKPCEWRRLALMGLKRLSFVILKGMPPDKMSGEVFWASREYEKFFLSCEFNMWKKLCALTFKDNGFDAGWGTLHPLDTWDSAVTHVLEFLAKTNQVWDDGVLDGPDWSDNGSGESSGEGSGESEGMAGANN